MSSKRPISGAARSSAICGARKRQTTVPIIYGGSVKPENCEAIVQEPDVDGFLVGNASLDVETFMKILQCQKG